MSKCRDLHSCLYDGRLAVGNAAGKKSPRRRSRSDRGYRHQRTCISGFPAAYDLEAECRAPGKRPARRQPRAGPNSCAALTVACAAGRLVSGAKPNCASRMIVSASTFPGAFRISHNARTRSVHRAGRSHPDPRVRNTQYIHESLAESDYSTVIPRRRLRRRPVAAAIQKPHQPRVSTVNLDARHAQRASAALRRARRKRSGMTA